MKFLQINKEKNLIFLIFSFFFSLIFIHTIYIFFITPSALELINLAKVENLPPPINLSVLLKDLEQEICLIIFLWAFLISLLAYMKTSEELMLLDSNESTQNILNNLLSSNLKNPDQDIKSLIENKSDLQIIDMSLVKYMSWAIPSIGFIGTVRGIGMALEKSGEAISGDISGMTESLGLAFNSTFIALFLSIFIMLIINLIEQQQDHVIIKMRSNFQEN